jgi:O-antigen ligase
VATLLYLKELIVVLALSIPLFAVAKPTALLFMDEGDFNRRRNVWLTLTIAAFLSPSFWLFVAIAVPVLYWGGKKDANPIALYLLLLNVIPTISIPIPGILVNQFFNLNILRLLSLCVIVPAALRLRRLDPAKRVPRLPPMDLAVLGLGVLQVFLFVPPDLGNQVILKNSATNDLRNAFLFLIDIYALYYLASRSCNDRRKLLDALAAFCVSCCLMATVAVFESVRHWLLYTDLAARWGGDAMLTEYYFRGPFLRAQASSGQPLALGFLLVVGLGFWLYLGSNVTRTRPRIAVTVLLCAGLLVTFSRGPWLAAIVTFFAYAALRSRMLKAVLVFAVLGGALIASPMGSKVLSMVPAAGGKVGASTLTYREQLFARSLQLIEAHPIFGDQLALSQMQDMRQGQGIIDITNTYIQVTLFYGFVGLTLFMWFILYGFFKVYRALRDSRRNDPDIALLGACIAACIFGCLVLFADVSLEDCTQRLFYVLVAFAVPYVHLAAIAKRDRPASAVAVPHAADSPARTRADAR